MPENSAANSAAPTGGVDFAQAHRDLIADRSLQFQFDTVTPPAPPDTPAWMEAIARFFQIIAPVLNYVFWAGVVLLGALILWMIGREILNRFSPRARDPAAKDAPQPRVEFRPAKERARALLEEADRLAREGRFSEAARVLLHRSIEDMERAFPITIGPALTSREIARIEPLSAQGRDAFTRIALAVETSLFGARPLDAARFAECRSAYEAFAFQKPAR